jgi:hypothetical protein
MRDDDRYFTSTNYDDFVLILGNRKIRETHVKALGKEYEELGGFREEIRVNPTQVNGKWVVMDGQHRFTYCKRKGYPLHVMKYRQDLSLTDLQRVNKVRVNWNLEDLIRSYAALGYQDYQRLLRVWEELYEEYKIAPATVAYIAQGNLTNTQNGKSRANLKEGNWKFVVPEEKVRRVIQECARFTTLDPKCLTAIFIHCIFKLRESDVKFSIERLHAQATKFHWKFIPASRKIDMFRMIDEIYNFRKGEANRHRIDINL